MNTEIDWNDVIKKEAKGNKNLDLSVQETSNGLILVQRYRKQGSFQHSSVQGRKL
ncbi:hypothetical protein [Candidatus Nitrosocosmicus arcticus]|uniref:Uncharacterized protein n=1 Tax=Candidatus Nitrosocosmicus arcticus TaxID=2035267 RepID=A0A557SZ95_9ARCH|nr:hypothetical protein [Candidatus Nitrosocosmicus arcticus]TVP41923.1 hypothetical protein NARC_10329 [Candidatus Nitrosocosmicus arcticus]